VKLIEKDIEDIDMKCKKSFNAIHSFVPYSVPVLKYILSTAMSKGKVSMKP